MKYSGFEPVFDASSKILILGSFPSVKSREQRFYYGNRQNRFWSMLALATGERLPLSVEERRALVLRHGIALWDIVAECEIVGSMDASIREYTVADLSVILSVADIKKILLNGSKAYGIFAKSYPELLGIAKRMPSTSSANVRYDGQIWQKEFESEY